MKSRGLNLENLESRCMLAFSIPNTVAVGDFNGDGHSDMAMGKPFETVGYMEEAGLVEVVYGDTLGLNSTHGKRSVWHQDVPGVKGVASKFDRFGWALAVGDFNGDGYDDLAVSASSESHGGKAGAGSVHVLFGSATGLTSINDERWHQGIAGISGINEAGDRFGYSLTAGDFDGDGFDDLAISKPYEDLTKDGRTVYNAGQVHVIYGSSSGLTTIFGTQLWSQQSSGVWGSWENEDAFGKSLAAGDFNGDGYDDLAIGTPTEDMGKVVDAGVVHILYGSADGLSSALSQHWHQNSPGIWSSNENGDLFGNALAVGDFNDDGYDDLAIGAQGEDLNINSVNTLNAGVVHVIYGIGYYGLTSEGDQYFYQGKGISGKREANDWFGKTLAVGDFNGDGHDDLAIGTPKEDWNTITDSGVVQVLYGNAYGISTIGDQQFHQNTKGIWGSDEKYDRFGSALAVGDFNNDGLDDLCVEADGEGLLGAADHGVVSAIHGAANGLYGDDIVYSKLYKIDIVFKDNGLNYGQQKKVFEAAQEWSKVIRANLPEVKVKNRGVVDDLVIEVKTELLDGKPQKGPNTLAKAGPRGLRNANNLPYIGEMTIDTADRGDRRLSKIALHEIGHVLGFNGGTLAAHNLLNASKNYIGASGVAEYRRLLGRNVSAVPMASAAHWREQVFGDELMTPSAGSSNPMSRLTVALLKDLGYRVSYAYVDSYSLPNALREGLRASTTYHPKSQMIAEMEPAVVNEPLKSQAQFAV